MNFIKNKTYLRFIMYFVLYGVIIAIVTSFVSYKLQFSNIEDKIEINAEFTAKQQMRRLSVHIRDIEKNLDSLSKNPIFHEYLKNTNKQTTQLAESLFLHASMSNINFFQVRFIDLKGKEKIRIDKERATKKSFVVPQKDLQNKSRRYYFQESIFSLKDTFWRSNIDLNIEHHVLEKPIRPTLRIATPVFSDGKREGILIVNVDLTELFNSIANNIEFDLFIIDKEGYFLLHPNPKYSWSKYTKSYYNLQNVFPLTADNIINQKNYKSLFLNSFSIDKIIQNNEELMLVLITKGEYIDKLNKNNYQLTLYLVLLILVISIPLGILISIGPTRLQNELNKILKINKDQLDIIDKFVVVSKTDLKGVIISASTALSELSGYKKEEMIGKKHTLFKSGKMPYTVYNSLWDTITRRMTWSGELQNMSKEGKYFWLSMKILPHYNEQDNLDGYIAIASDATAQKTMEYLSEHDKLTTLYNRGKIDSILEKEIYKAQHSPNAYALMLIDIDNFKQVNDNYGHLIGDATLVDIAAILKRTISKEDTVGRWGGEEFLVICTSENFKNLIDLAEKLRNEVENHQFKEVTKVTISIGISKIEKYDTAKRRLKQADELMYLAKASGRNCVKY